MANPAREQAWQRRLSPAPSVGCRFAPAGEGPCSSLWARGDDSEQLKWLYVLSSSTVALAVDAAAAAEWKKQENMCINLKNLNLLGSCSLVRRLVPVPVLLGVESTLHIQLQLRLLPRPVICELNYCTHSCLAVAAAAQPPPPPPPPPSLLALPLACRQCSITGAVVFCGCHFVIYSAPWPAHWPGSWSWTWGWQPVWGICLTAWLDVAVNEFVRVRVLIRVRLPLRVGCLRIWMLMSAWHPINLVRWGFAFIAPLA